MPDAGCSSDKVPDGASSIKKTAGPYHNKSYDKVSPSYHSGSAYICRYFCQIRVSSAVMTGLTAAYKAAGYSL
jgi:hypothetical protein